MATKSNGELLNDLFAAGAALEKRAKQNAYQDVADELFAIRKAFIKAGFDENMADALILEIIKK